MLQKHPLQHVFKDSSTDFSCRTMPAAHPNLGIPHLYCIELILERTHVLTRSRHGLLARVRRGQSSRPAAFAPAAAAHVGPRRGVSAGRGGQAWQPAGQPAGTDKPRLARTVLDYGRPAAAGCRAPGPSVPISPRRGDTVPAVTAPRGPGRAVAPTAAVTGSHHASIRLPTRSHLVPRSRRPSQLPPGRGLPARPRARSRGGAALPGGRPGLARRTPPHTARRGKAGPAGGASGSRGHKAALCPVRAAQEPRRGRHLLSRWRREEGRQQAGAGEGRRRGGRPSRAAAGRTRLPSGPPDRSRSPALRKAARSRRGPGDRTKRQHGGDGGEGEERRGSREASGARGQGGGRGRAALTGIWLLIEDCSLIIQPGCGRHRRGQEEQNQEEEEEEALEAAELPAGVRRRRRRGEGPYSGCGGRAALRAAPGGRGCTRRDTRRRLPHERPGPHLSRASLTSGAATQSTAPSARLGRARGRGGRDAGGVGGRERRRRPAGTGS